MSKIHNGGKIDQAPYLGWISLNADYCTHMAHLSHILNQIFNDHQGQIFTTYVHSISFYEEGIVFSSEPITKDEATGLYIHQLSELDWEEQVDLDDMDLRRFEDPEMY